MWFLLLLHFSLIEPIILQERLILRNGGHPCEGHAEIYHEGTRGYVGDKGWNENTEAVVCRSTSCGERVSSMYVPRSTDETVWLNEVQCSGTEGHLWECNYPGWNISNYRKEYVKKINCSNDIKISLDGFKCAGAVQYTVDGKHSGYICADNWRKEEANLLCKELGCGEGNISAEPFMVWERFKSSKKMVINCQGIVDVENLWQCVTQEKATCQSPVSVICTGHQIPRLSSRSKNACSGELERKSVENISRDAWCSHLHCGSYKNHTDKKKIQLTCTDNVALDLMDRGVSTAEKCYGEVHMKVNGKSHPVCATEAWTMENAKVVCSEMNCGDVVNFETKESPSVTGIMDYVRCAGTESSLWHCDAQHHQRSSTPFACKNKASVTCAARVEVRLKDGPGECAGRVEVLYNGEWKSVSEDGWTETNSDVVCRELGCGEKSIYNPEKFSQGSGNFLEKTVSCTSTAKNISECIKSTRARRANAKGITCKAHKVLFLKQSEGRSCSGAVGIVKANKTFWLSGSSETWNNESANAVCRQMLCGEATSFHFRRSSDKTKDIWQESYNCSANATSLFACEKTPQPPDHSNSTATVNCAAKTEVNLTNECWGYVNVCVEGTCGGVQAESWADEKSVMLCKNLGCGDRVLPKLSPSSSESQVVIFKSLHTTKHTTHLKQCNFVRYDKNDKTSGNPAYLICSGSVKSRINTTRDKCSGNVEVQYGDKWLPVCPDALKDSKARDAICGELKCGSSGETINYSGPVPASGPVISQIQCPGSSDKSLKACTVTYTSGPQPCVPAGLQCADWRKMALENSEKSCSGNVIVRSASGKNSVSIEGWTHVEGAKLCQSLDCGNLTGVILNKTYISLPPLNSSFRCARAQNPESSIWDCEGQPLPSQKQPLYVECQGEPNVTLSKSCHGEVQINGIKVCSTGWKEEYSHLLCQEQGCSNAILHMPMSAKVKSNQEYYHVSCENHHYKLGQCKRFKAKCEENLVSVYCVNNVYFNTSEKCGGQIQVSYQGDGIWDKVCPSNLNDEFKNQLCKNLGCKQYKRVPKIKTSQKVNLQTQLIMENCKDIRHGVKRSQNACNNVMPAEIYCEGYVIPIAVSKVNVLPIILGVLFALVLVILLAVFARFYFTRRANKSMNAPDYSLRNEDDFESGEYEDVPNKENEMEDSGGRFRSESEMIVENDASLNYDDIDEVTEDQPLTSQAGSGASRNNYMQKGAPDHGDEGVTYEVDDPQENYDDIEAPPEVSQTTAEVHDGTRPTPESVTEPQIALVEGDDDYLVPGQDG